MIPIVPALIPTSENDAKEILTRLQFSPEVHLDVVDGKFTPHASWPYDPEGQIVAIRHLSDTYTLEVDLMVQEPLTAAVDWIAAGADMLVFHCETISLENFKKFTKFTHVSVGISCHGNTPIETVLEYAEYADYVQLMGIKEIGAQGQPFNREVLDAIQQIKDAYPEKLVSVDGSVNVDTIEAVAKAGADRLIVGSAITLESNPEAAHRTLSLLIK